MGSARGRPTTSSDWLPTARVALGHGSLVQMSSKGFNPALELAGHGENLLITGQRLAAQGAIVEE
jgi:hypothetical protein